MVARLPKRDISCLWRTVFVPYKPSNTAPPGQKHPISSREKTILFIIKEPVLMGSAHHFLTEQVRRWFDWPTDTVFILIAPIFSATLQVHKNNKMATMHFVSCAIKSQK